MIFNIIIKVNYFTPFLIILSLDIVLIFSFLLLTQSADFVANAQTSFALTKDDGHYFTETAIKQGINWFSGCFPVFCLCYYCLGMDKEATPPLEIEEAVSSDLKDSREKWYTL